MASLYMLDTNTVSHLIKRQPQAIARLLEVPMPWDDAVAQTYGTLRAELQKNGRPLAALDLQIAAHALHLKATLVSNDSAFAQVGGLAVEDWVRV